MEQFPIGRAKTVLIVGSGDDEVAVISSVVARVHDDDKERISFNGPVEFDESVSGHITEVVLPVADRIFSLLEVPLRNFQISVVNLSIASQSDIGLKISGFSADVPVLLAMLSAGLEIPIPEDVVSTGHIASSDGDIGLVKSIPVKLEAALGHNNIHKFIYPSIDEDNSLKTISPMKGQEIEDAITRARRDIHIVAVKDVGELMEVVFTKESKILASLRQGFFNRPGLSMNNKDRIGTAARVLAQDNETHFWSAVEQ